MASSTTVSLRIRHPSLSPDEISEGLGIAFRVARKSGEVRTTPDGAPLAGINEGTYWTAKLYSQDSRGIALLLEAVLDFLDKRKAGVQKIIKSGGSIEVSIGWFLKTDDAERLSPEILKRCADNQIGLLFDVYVPPARDLLQSKDTDLEAEQSR
jgi:hypothetical protein